MINQYIRLKQSIIKDEFDFFKFNNYDILTINVFHGLECKNEFETKLLVMEVNFAVLHHQKQKRGPVQ